MWEADKIYYNGEDDFVSAFQNGKLIWAKAQEIILFTDRDGLSYSTVKLVPNQPNYVPVRMGNEMPIKYTMTNIPNGVTEVYWRNYDNRKNNIKSLKGLNEGNGALITFDAEGSNFEGITNMSRMFYNCRSLTTISQLNTSDVTDMSYMFRYCESLTTIPQLNSSNVTDMIMMFSECYSLTTVPQLDTSNVTNMSYMFTDCNSLTTIPQLDTSNVTDMSGMFRLCESLTAIPHLDTSKATNMESMFQGCKSLTTIPQIDTSNATDMYHMFRYCNSLTTIPQLNTSNVIDMTDMFEYCKVLENVGGFIGLKVDLDMGYCPLTLESVFNIANNAAVVTQGQTITFSERTHSLLTDDVIGIFTSKGWTIN